jgi:hypothetical protein
VDRLVAAYRPERIYLFGSHARGEPGPDSDFDLLVLVPDDAEPERRRSRLANPGVIGILLGKREKFVYRGLKVPLIKGALNQLERAFLACF